MSKIELQKFQTRTDLAFEALNFNRLKDLNQEFTDEQVINNVVIKRTFINENVALEIGKKPGIYYCLDSTNILSHDHDDLLDLEDALTFVIKDILEVENITPNKKGLIVGLGNINVTPDSLGPLVIDNVIVTRHMFMLDPTKVSEGISNVCAMSPGVMGQTGIETFDIIQAIVDKIDIDYIIVCDALASRSVSRLNKTIQVTNAGISPGSGVGNKRKELSRQTINRPVIAIGVPTVVDAVSIVSDTIDKLLENFNKHTSNNLLEDEGYRKHFLGEVGVLSDEEKRALFEEVLTTNGQNMMVTPKEIDLDIEDLSKVISGAIDRAIHKIVEHN